MGPELTYIIISLAFSAFFAGIEIAFVSADKLQIAVQEGNGGFSSRVVSKFIKNPSLFIGTTLVGLTIAQVVYGIYIAALLEPKLAEFLPSAINNDFTVMVSQTIISTIIVITTAEFLPKSLFLVNPNFMLTFFAIPMNVFYYGLNIPVKGLIWLTKVFLNKAFGISYLDENPAFGLTDLNNYIQTQVEQSKVGQETKSEIDTKILSNALDFKNIKVRDCMRPRTELVAVDLNYGLDYLKKVFLESGHSKVLIYSETIDNIIGYCHSKELFKKPHSIQDILTTIPMVPEVAQANDLLIEFIEQRKSIAVVLDEFGGTAGIITLEDIMEEIFGEINDEHDEVENDEQQLDEHNYIFSARLEIDYLNDKYNWSIPTGDYDTLGGYIIDKNQDIPVEGNLIDIPPFTFTIISKNDARLDKVKVTYLPEEHK